MPGVHDDSEQEMPDFSSNDHIDADAEDGDFQSLLQNHVDEQNF